METITKQLRTHIAARIIIFTLAGGCLSTSSMLLAQQDGPPPDFNGPRQDGPPAMESVKRQLARMTHRYGLTSSQQEIIRPILDAERQKTDEIVGNTSLPPQDKFVQAKAIHEEVSVKIAAVLTDTQKAKFEQDEARRDAREQRQQNGADMEGPPPPPDGGVPPPP